MLAVSRAILNARRQIDGVADEGEFGAMLGAHLAFDQLAGVQAQALAQGGKFRVQILSS